MKDLAADLRTVQGDTPDYHPGSDNQVIDLLHPSLFCYAEGQTIARSGCVGGQAAAAAAAIAAADAAMVCRTGRRINFEGL